LGLAICREIIRASKGDIKIVSPLPEKQLKELEVTSEDGIVGTMFDIHLPISIAPNET
jgi:signal transduction histidine kinase